MQLLSNYKKNKIMKLKFRTQLLIPNITALVLMLIIAFVVFFNLKSSVRDANWVKHTHNVINKGDELLVYMIDKETGMRGYAITGEEDFLEPYIDGSEKFGSLIVMLKNNVSDNQAQVSLINNIEIQSSLWKTNVAEKYINMRRSIKEGENERKKLFDLIKTGTNKRDMDNLRRLVAMSGLSREAKDQITIDMINMETGLRGFLLNSKEEYLEPYNNAKSLIDRHFINYKVGRSIEDAAYKWINDYAEEAIKINRAAMNTIQMDKLYEEFTKKEGKKYMDKIRSLLTTFIETEKKLLTKRKEETASAITMTQSLLIIITLFAIIFSLIIVIIITRNVMRMLGGEPNEVANIANNIANGELNINVQNLNSSSGVMKSMYMMVNKLKNIISIVINSSEYIANSSDEMSASSQEMSESSNEQASAAEEVSATMEQMQANIQQNANNAKETEDIAIKATHNIEDGGKAVNETVKAMNVISEKIKIINEIAFQTNILALNATIEASHVGDAGSGFAVVAGEIKELANKSRKAANEINKISTNSMKIADKAEKLFKKIVPEIQRTAELVQNITISSREQNTSVNQVTNAIKQLNTTTQQTSAVAEEVASSSEELSSQAEQLKQIIGFFNIGNTNYKQTYTNKNNEYKLSTEKIKGYNLNLSKTEEDTDFETY